MPSSRRRFLAGVAALSTAVAGCNEESPRSVEETVTPVEVPRTDGDVLREVASVDVPEIPSPVVVSNAHHRAAVEHVETLRESVVTRLEATDDSFGFDGLVRVPTRPESLLEDIEHRLEEARRVGPSQQSLERLRDVHRTVATADGYLRARADELDTDALRSDIDAGRAAASDLRERFDYRIADPVEYLPTAYEAERSLATLDDLGHAEVRLANVETDADGDVEPDPKGNVTVDIATQTESATDAEREVERRNALLAEVYARLERHRRRRDDVVRYLETATVDDTPSIRTTLDSELAAVREELVGIVDRNGFDEGDRPQRATTVAELRSIRWSVGRRCERYLSNRPENPKDGRLLRELLDGVRRVTEFRAIDAGIERTLPQLDGPEFPTGGLPEAKRDAVEAVERAAEATALQRQFAATSQQVLSAADHTFGQRREPVESDGIGASDVGERALARAHLLYVAAGEWADRALDRGESFGVSP